MVPYKGVSVNTPLGGVSTKFREIYVISRSKRGSKNAYLPKSTDC